MKKIFHTFLVSFCIACTFQLTLSCSSRGDDNDVIPDEPEYHLKFKINGTQTAYTSQGGWIDGNYNAKSSNIFGASVAGRLEALNSNKNIVAIAIGKETEFSTGITYTNYSTSLTAHQKVIVFLLSFIDENGVQYSALIDESIPYAPGQKADGKVTFTEITDNIVKGTFSGIVYNLEDKESSLILTDGEFKARRIN